MFVTLLIDLLKRLLNRIVINVSQDSGIANKALDLNEVSYLDIRLFRRYRYICVKINAGIDQYSPIIGAIDEKLKYIYF